MKSLPPVVLERHDAVLELMNESLGAYAEWTGTDIGRAASAQTMGLACAICSWRQVGAILELGSGLSSAVLRAATTSLVVSVDDDLHWLNRTGRFLDEHGAPRGVLALYDAGAFVGPYDLVFHDMGDMDVRARTLEWAMTRVAPGGLLLLDDMHFVDYADLVERTVLWKRYDVRECTTDDYGRFAALFERPS